MKKLLNNASLQHVVNASITTRTNKRFTNFNYVNANHTMKKSLLQSFAVMMFIWLVAFQPATAQPNSLTGGIQTLAITPTVPGGAETVIQFVNNTGRDVLDLKILTNNGNKIKSYEINGKAEQHAAADVEPSATSIHPAFNAKPIVTEAKFSIKLKFKAPLVAGDSCTFIPTDALGADMLNNTLGISDIIGFVTTPLKGGSVNVTFAPSNFCSLAFTNTTTQDICDLRILNAKTATGQPVNIDKVFVNNVQVSTSTNKSSVHVNIPSVPPGGKFTVAVKFHGTTEAVTYNIVPTNAAGKDIMIKIPLRKDEPVVPPNHKTEKKAELGGGNLAGKCSGTFHNNTGQELCGLVITCAKKINTIEVNGNVWLTNPPNKISTMLQVFAGISQCVAADSTFLLSINLDGTTAKISSFTISAVNSNNKIILTENVTGGVTQFLMPNSFAPIGLTSRSGSLVAINESCSPISQLVFASPDSGVKIASASSTLPSSYNNTSKTLTFNPPVASGAMIDYNFVINHLLPYSPTDSFPYTTLTAKVPGVTNPLDGGAYITPSGCAGVSSGSIDYVVTEGVAPHTFLWSNGSTTEDIANLVAGTYSVTVNGGGVCMKKSFVVNENQPALQVIPISQWCAGANDGTAIAEADGMTGPVSYLWSNGSTEQRINNLDTGNYSVIVTDSVGCVLSGTTNITPATPVSVTGTTVKLNCNNDSSGAVNIIPLGGTGYYYFKWNNGTTVQNRSGLKAATYTVIINDGFGCSTTASFKVKQPTAITPAITTTPVLCAGGNSGANSSAASGGTFPYSYLWSNGMTTSAINGLTAGIYDLTITDAHGCTKVSSCNVPQPPPLMVNVMPAGPNQAIANVSGGVPPYTYQWNTVPPQTTQIATGLMPNQTYMVNVHDSHNCQQMGGITMPPNRIGFYGDDFNVKVYPNPASGILSVEIVNANAEKYVIELLDVTGRIVCSSTQLINSYSQTQLDLTSLAEGVYSLKVSSDNKVKVVKVMLRKD